jgi:hypothetical protein
MLGSGGHGGPCAWEGQRDSLELSGAIDVQSARGYAVRCARQVEGCYGPWIFCRTERGETDREIGSCEPLILKITIALR